jgi:hypothetical protein
LTDKNHGLDAVGKSLKKLFLIPMQLCNTVFLYLILCQ